MSGFKHMMDEVAARMEITDPNDPRVKAEVERLLSITDRRLVILESHPNSGGFWVGKLGTEREIREYLKDQDARGDLDYLFQILELKEDAHDEIASWIEFEDGSPTRVKSSPPRYATNGTPPLPGLETRLAGIQAEAYGQKHSVWSILQSMTDQEIAETFGQVLETVMQKGRTLVIPEGALCQPH